MVVVDGMFGVVGVVGVDGVDWVIGVVWWTNQESPKGKQKQL